jgi:hypothetical protein
MEDQSLTNSSQTHSHGHKEHQHPHHEAAAPAQPQPAKAYGPFGIHNKAVIILFMVAILAITIYARLGLSHAQGLFEPDGFFYYSIIRATIANHLFEPQHLGISGFPTHNFIGEAPGLPYLTVIFYLLLGWSGVGYLAIMRNLPVFFGILEVILAYFLAKELSNSELCGLLAALFVGVSAGNIARTAALVYRGDTFITLPLMLALLVLLKGMKVKSEKIAAVLALFAAFVISTGVLVWNGSPFIIAIYIFSLVLLVVYSFVSWKPELLRRTLIFTAALFIVFLLQNLYLHFGAARSGLALEGWSFLIFYIPVMAFALLAYMIMRKGRVGLLHKPIWRAIGAAVVILIVAGAVGIVFKGAVGTIASSAGVSVPVSTSQSNSIAYAVGATTQELQKPSFSFLFASFGLQLYLLFIGVLAFIFLMRDKVMALFEQHSRRQLLWAIVGVGELALIVIIYLVHLSVVPGFLYSARYFVVYSLVLADLLLAFYLMKKAPSGDMRIAMIGGICLWLLIGWSWLWYASHSFSTPLFLTILSFMIIAVSVYDDTDAGEGSAFNAIPYLVIFAYLAITAYLQYNAIRYNSLISIPAAIFAAYGVYIMMRKAGSIRISNQTLGFVFAIGVVAVLLVLSFFWLGNLIHTGNLAHSNWYLFEGYLTIIIMATLMGYLIVPLIRSQPVDLKIICLLAVALVILFSCVFTIVESYSSSQADGINPSFLSAMGWLKNNTATNATVLALWPDGSVVEGWGNRTSYMDSVGGENATRIYYFARYLANDSIDSQYLYSIGKPEYIVARQYWLTELSGLIAEGVPADPQNYTFTPLSASKAPQQNATAQLYFFSNGYYNVTLVNKKQTNSTAPPNYTAYLQVPSQGPGLYRVSAVTLYNISSQGYTEFNSTGTAINYTFMLFYSGSQIQGAIILNNQLYKSNLFKLVWLCNQYQCPYSNGTAKISPVFANNDTRIYKVSYT